MDPGLGSPACSRASHFSLASRWPGVKGHRDSAQGSPAKALSMTSYLTKI